MRRDSWVRSLSAGSERLLDVADDLVPGDVLAVDVRVRGILDAVDEATRWLCPQEIQLDLDVPDRQEALQAVSAMVVGHLRQVNAPPVFRALWRREQAGSTAVGNALAIPHARIAGITEPMFGLRSCSGSAQGAARSEPKA